ncbi:MAG TPA: VCBS repeat-containing protein [Solirubrobacterales bacterium]|nr:VCBS repeat-containing protein [Solirubrobacterales bacterium]
MRDGAAGKAMHGSPTFRLLAAFVALLAISLLTAAGASASLAFQPHADYATGPDLTSDPTSVAIGDFNGDGKPDLAVANRRSDSVSVLLGEGDGRFAAEADYATGSSPFSVAIGDFNGDGRPDLAVANSGSDSVSVLLGHGDGSFAAKADYATGTFPISVAIGDLNGDGKPDLAVADAGSGNVSVLLGIGDGSFTPKADYATGTEPCSVAIGDLNGDGKPDLAVANRRSDSVSVLLGHGDGIFAAKADYATGSSPESVAIGDLNGDDRPDLAVANRGADNVSVLLGEGDGSFAAKADYATGTGPAAVAIGDLNGDGRPDLAVANFVSSSVSVLLNSSVFPGGGAFEPKPQTITFTAPPDHTLGDPDFDPGATAGSGLPVTYTSQSAPVCTIVSDKVHMIAAGTCEVTAEQPGDAEYEAAAPVQRTFAVVKAEASDATAASATPVVVSPLPRTTVLYSPNHRHKPNPRGGSRYTFVFADEAADVTFYCRLDKASFERCHSPKVYRHLGRGRHVFRVKSVDAAGNSSSVQVVHFTAGRRPG